MKFNSFISLSANPVHTHYLSLTKISTAVPLKAKFTLKLQSTVVSNEEESVVFDMLGTFTVLHDFFYIHKFISCFLPVLFVSLYSIPLPLLSNSTTPSFQTPSLRKSCYSHGKIQIKQSSLSFKDNKRQISKSFFCVRLTSDLTCSSGSADFVRTVLWFFRKWDSSWEIQHHNKCMWEQSNFGLCIHFILFSSNWWQWQSFYSYISHVKAKP